jgi:hypothetical protein
MRRRLFLLGGPTAFGLTGCSTARSAPTASAAAASAPSIDPGMGPLTAIIEYEGNTYRYEESTGVDLGDYADPRKRFVQGCRRVINDQLPLTVFFRPDRDSHRAEVVFELGRLWSKTPPANLGAYKVTILRGDRTVFTTDVPLHYWFSRWRWQSSPRPVTGKVSDLMASGLLPHYDNQVNQGTAHPIRAFTYQIMDVAGIARAMPMTGERNDIGAVTEWQGEYICTGNESALETVLAQAEGAGTLPWYFRDERTGAPLDVIRYAKATIYDRQSGDPYIATTKTGIGLDSAHMPAVAYLPFLLTGDPYHLETLQFQVTFNYLELPGPARYRTNQTRGQAWILRNLGQAATVTPEVTPQWLMHQSYFSELLKLKHDWISQTFVSSTDPVRTAFRTIEQIFSSGRDGGFDPGTKIAPWQEEFLAFILCWLILMGHTDWEPIARWKIGSCVARTDGTSGWVRAIPTPYLMAVREHGDSAWLTAWAAAWALNKDRWGWQYDDPNHLSIRKGGDITYPVYTRGALAIATRLGFTEANPCFEWLDSEIRLHLSHGIRLDYKWSVA